MFELYDKVRIKSSTIVGTIIDISDINGHINYVVESEKKNISGGYGGDWKLFDCSTNEIEKVN